MYGSHPYELPFPHYRTVLPCRLVKRLATDLETRDRSRRRRRATNHWHRVVSLLGEGAGQLGHTRRTRPLGGIRHLTIDSSHTAHERTSAATPRWRRHLPADATVGDGLAKRYKVPPGSLAKGKWNELSIKVFNPTARDDSAVAARRFRATSSSAFSPANGNTVPAPPRHLASAPGQTKPCSVRPVSRGQPRVVRGTKTRPRERLSPAESLKKFKLAQGLVVETVLHEPLVAQPTHLSFDARGRLWVSHYVQYPTRPGCARSVATKYYRAKYDRQPKPPPHHTPAAAASPSTRTPIAMAPTTPTRCSSTNSA